MRKFLFVLFCLLFFLLVTPVAHADNNFATTFVGTYTVKDSGITHVVYNVSLKNLTDKYYVTSYSLQLGFSDIENIYASDPDGSILPELKKTTDGQAVTFHFNHRSIGLGSTLSFTFSFDTSNVATQNGSIWEVNIPGLQDENEFTNFQVSVNVPSDFGTPVYEKPDVGNSLIFTKDQLGKSGISLAFGQEQVYHFTLAYHLKNTQLFPVHTEIALPPNTSYQDVSLDSLEPKPLDVKEDKDGNWLAEYSLLPSQLLTVHAQGRAFLSLRPQSSPLSLEEKIDDLKPTAYWQTKNAKIQQLAKDLQTPYAIYEYVTKTLHYDFSRVSDNQDRLGAVAVLQDPSSAVCLEFTDLFIAIARAAGIPAREVDGYAYTQNTRERPLSLQKEVLHAWPQYYDQDRRAWVMVDPTWENTTGGVDYFHTFDFDHIAFVIKGQTPDYPIPAGGYKLPGEEDLHDVSVDFAQDTSRPDPESSIDALLPIKMVAGLPVAGSIVVSNTGHVLFPSQKIHVTSSFPYFTTQDIIAPDIVPFGKVMLPFTLGKSPFLTNQVGKVTILIGGEAITKDLTITVFSLTFALIGGCIIGIFSIIIFIIAKRSRRISVSE